MPACARVWVTRPEHQAEGLCRLLKSSGVEVIRFPVIAIEAVADSPAVAAVCAGLAKFQYLIFVSRNAVRQACLNYLDIQSLPTNTGIIAIGQGTAAALREFGIEHVLHAGASADSEGLLALPELQADRIGDKDILLVRGQGGRDLLFNTLTQRGARVEIAEVYMRKPPQYDKNELDRMWRQSQPAAIIVTSNEAIQFLVDLVPAEHQDRLLQTPLVVMSARNAQCARDLGFRARVVVTRAQNDAGLHQATIELLETVHT